MSQRVARMHDVAIGVYAAPCAPEVAKTLRSLDESMPAATPRRVFPIPKEGTGSALAACLRQLEAECPADVYLVMEGGALPTAGSLAEMMAVFNRVPHCGLVGPSTNRALGPQGLFRGHLGDAATNAHAAKRRFGSAYRTLGRREYLDDFCIGVRSSLLAKGFVAYPNEANWVQEFSTRAAAASHPSLWACGAYVHRLPAAAPAPSERPAAAPLHEHGRTLRAPADSRAEPLAVPAAIPLPELPPALADEEDAPLASCIMPTYNRRTFVPRALRSFLCQDYPNRELIVVDDGTDRIEDLLPADPRVRYFRLDQRQNVGAKRNFACQQAQGQFVLHWDDDEWYAPSRIRLQVNALRHSPARVSGTSVALFYNENSDRAFRYCFGGLSAGWMGALAYPVAVWKERPFDCVAIAEDVRFISHVPVNRRLDLRDPWLYVASIHQSNTSPKTTTGSYWRAEPIESLKGVPGFAPIAAYTSAAGGHR